jgi:hypothetical protein
MALGEDQQPVCALAADRSNRLLDLEANARRAGLQYAETLARRDGTASRAALEALGGDALTAFKQRQLEWRKQDAATAAGFSAGVAAVETLLRGLGPDHRKTKAIAWADAYAKNAGAADFTVVRERMFPRLGGYDKQTTTSPPTCANCDGRLADGHGRHGAPDGRA